MKKKIGIAIAIGFILSIAFNLIPLGSSSTEVGQHYHHGFPFKTYQMLGDAPYKTPYMFLLNLFFWSVVSFIGLKLWDKRKTKSKNKK